MTRKTTNQRLVALALTTALATATLGGCTTHAAPPANVSANQARVELEKGRTEKAVDLAEAAVLADPRNAQYRAMLGATYMEAGRFQSASTSFHDAMSLGDNSARTALSYALAETAVGHYARAQAVLNDWSDAIDPADLGLAFALSGRPDRGIEVLGNTLRGGQNTAKVRQNLAYAYALAGDWRSARLMASEDVPPDQINDRISEWAHAVQPGAYQARVASLLDVPMVADAGQPVALALNNNPSSEQLAAEATALAANSEPSAPAPYYAAAPAGELPPVEAAPQLAVAEPQVEQPETVEAAFAAEAPAGATLAQMTESALRFVSQPVVQKMPARYGAQAAPRRRVRSEDRPDTAERVAAAPAPTPGGDHLIQLGSFSSREGARRAWGIYAKRYPQLGQYDMVITEARVRGKTYFRVSAGGFDTATARSMCSTVRSGGEGCFAWSKGRPLPGAIDSEVRMAHR